MSQYHIRSYAYTNQAGVRSGLSAIGADATGLRRMLEKSAFFCLGGSGISAPAALILKQEALARGAEAVIHRDVLVGRIDRSRFALLGTERQIREICHKLRVQAFGLPVLAAELEEALANLAVDRWQISLPRGGMLELGQRPLLMGILNVTPDSFSDGGRYLDPQAAVQHACQLVAEGADMIDIGAASSRPGFSPVSEEEELRRLLPALRAVRAAVDVPISIDSDKAPVVAAALAAGADIINDIGGLQADPDMAALAARTGAPVIVMHSGFDREDPIGALCDFLRKSMEIANAAGVGQEQIILDPGFGFGKEGNDDFAIMANLPLLRVLGRPILCGSSNKRCIGNATGAPLGERLPGNLAAATAQTLGGAAILRVHEVAQTKQAVALAQACGGGFFL